MGEYAILKNNKKKVKIGICEDMIYLRYEDIDKVLLAEGSNFGIFFRLPFPDEDNIEPGYYDGCRNYPLYNFNANDTIDNIGTIQLKHDSGLLVNVPCYHGNKLPETDNENINFFWNGKTSWFFELKRIKVIDDKKIPVITCRFCEKSWICDWDDILDYIQDEKLKKRLEKYANE